ncbi:MAG: hypothetical protein LWX56_06610, partial [Ignavibacteria bacterium]|nr:hypothetical protein [Ignavibacteria bacterium]
MNSPVLLDLSSYKLPQDRNGQARLATLYPALPRNSEQVPFDVYNYEMLFRDPGVLDIIRTGRTIGCFYIESPGMRSLLRKLSVDTFEMLTAASSIIRPGVAESGMMQEFIARHKEPARRTYLVPEMEAILGETYGVMIYQEDVIKIAHHIAGLSLEEADLLRRAMSGKMRSHDAMLHLQQKFFISAQAKGYRLPIVQELWRQIESFAGYAFCKAHSASFALLSFQVAFLKVHYPAEFMAGVLSNGGGYYSAAVYIQECKRLGLTVLLPSVNHSEYEYTGQGVVVRIGLMAIKNLPKTSAETIVQERKKYGQYTGLDNLIARTALGFEDCSKLIRCGTMECFHHTRPTLFRLLDMHFYRRNLRGGFCADLFAHESIELEQQLITSKDFSLAEKCTAEMEIFDYMISSHPLQFFPGFISQPGIIQAADMDKYHGKFARMVGWYMTSKRVRTKKGEIMKFLSLEDLSDTFEAILFPRAYEQFATDTLTMGPFLVSGTIDTEGG